MQNIENGYTYFILKIPIFPADFTVRNPPNQIPIALALTDVLNIFPVPSPKGRHAMNEADSSHRAPDSTLQKTAADTRQFWDELFAKESRERPFGSLKLELENALKAACAFFGDLKGKTVIDVGCGDGASSLFLASRGATVVALDQSSIAIQNLQEFCVRNNITTIQPIVCNAFDVAQHGPADFLFGSMILHHIEPFADFVAVLQRALCPKGRAFFFENSSASSLLLWARTHVVGKFWIPKYGDEDEHPLSRKEVQLLARNFGLRQEFPELLLFRLVPIYLFKGRMLGLFRVFDEAAFHLRPLRRYSYRQYLYLENRPYETSRARLE
jgi:2-polyprenyl-3-methyl-5-hydroxy-6-metoxy-1,4-benzoquinol methylase